MPPANFRRAFTPGVRFENTGFGRFTVTVQRVGHLTLTTGRLVACDPVMCPESKPFVRQVPTGRFPVDVSIAHLQDGDERIGAAAVWFTNQSPETWELSTVPGDKPLAEMGDEEFVGYPVDAGIAGFMDKAAADILAGQKLAGGQYFDELDTVARPVYRPTRQWADFPLDLATGLNLVFFSSGIGDGLYPCYWGFDHTGTLACVATDFGILYED